ncbi:family 78 glycoside hydrolase catalytic domain [Paratractidigestivibacter sp.]|uniref:family 78 glycoside hydrolase catalytic domain n=1 Tax=Paratractidigestivibacter sp. TaxID=2847316 RepID=UPI002AC8B0D2|nr:family 78 glycoside hydrolase catalytic domain [Paratractidigestivibacter sp.]
MLTISRFTCEGLAKGCVTDERRPRLAFSLESDRAGAKPASATITVNGHQMVLGSEQSVRYDGPELAPRTTYAAHLVATDDAGETAEADIAFETGLLGAPFDASWISDAAYTFADKGASPVPMVFRRTLELSKPVASARIYATAMGIFDLELNGRRVGDELFAPGFTSYKTNLQYVTYDVTDQLAEKNELLATVAGGWAVGAFIYSRVNRVAADRQALLLQLCVTYEDGSRQTFGTDEGWEVTEDGPVRYAEFYDGEVYDARVSLEDATWRRAARETLRVSPRLTAACGDPVRLHDRMEPVSVTHVGDQLVFDFGQNFAGVVELRLRGAAEGQVVRVRHAEILKPDGTLNTDFLRSAKAELVYTCKAGDQSFCPTLTYMGFRYVGVEGADEKDLALCAYPVFSDVRETGTFACSNDKVNRLQQNIQWSSRSNFVDIPTDCPQRDERMGWTGDIAVFAPTACYNFDMGRFLRKWLRDVRAEQLRGGGIPNTVPANGFGFPTTMPSMAIDFWGDACVLVPWALYQAEGDEEVLRENYDMMCRYVDACRFWASFGVGKYRYIWHTPSFLHFGDWVAPDVPKMSQWQGRSKWTATASLQHTSSLVAQVAQILGRGEDARRYAELSQNVSHAYEDVFTDGAGKLKNEFQTAYVLPIHFGMLGESNTERAVDNLVKLVEKSDYCIGTGFPGTPYILFALADNGRADVAYKMLLNTKCPSWLYEVAQGATTIWERWDGLDENGQCPIGDDGTDMMISYNHYASGAIGDFLYKRVAGIEAAEPGYRRVRVAPLVGGGLTWASGSVETVLGRVSSSWKLADGTFEIDVEVPVGATCELLLPDGTMQELGSGSHHASCACQSDEEA